MDEIKSVKILMVDDRSENLFSLQIILDNENYQCIKANSGAEAIEIIDSQEDFSLILMDVQMPDLDGFETVQLIRKRESMQQVPVIFLTANMDTEHLFKGYEIGAVDYMIKPLTPEILRAKVAIFVDLYLKTNELLVQRTQLNKLVLEKTNANKELEFQNKEKEKRAAELILANNELRFQNEEKEKRAAELLIAINELHYQNKEKERKAGELVVANEELLFQNSEKEKRAAELIVANEELLFQNSEKEKRAAELIVANEELLFQNSEKEKRAAELIVANEELLFQNSEKEKRAAELIIMMEKLLYENVEKEKRAAELYIADQELKFQKSEKGKRADELIIANIKKEEAAKTLFLIKEKNKDILDSITYAKRIQQAKLPRKSDIFKSFPSSFILFKPKDIVSGDFYFYHESKNYLFLAAADCTGHGVPGALMSMIALEKLNAAVIISEEPSTILKLVNTEMKKSLRQSESFESTRDGMDIALCRIDKSTRMLHFTGANRPFWIIRNESSELVEIKGTKKSIGGPTENDQDFETHEIQLMNGDTFYLFTDGFADTFGGDFEKKLSTRVFKSLLIESQNKTMPNQGNFLQHFLENWIDGIGQVDDILVIGVRM